MTLRLEMRSLQVLGKAGARRELTGELTLEIPDGAVHTLMGPSGCGKSSLLAAVAGTLPANLHAVCQVWLDGQRIDHLRTERRRVGLLFQDALLFPHMNVHDNLLFGTPAGNRADRQAAVDKALRDMGLEQHAHTFPDVLSGGERARAALARALLARPRALLLDEPFSRLDAPLRQRMRELVFSTLRERGIPGLLVTHDEADIADPTRVTRLPSVN
ncbi:ATP-binding cassette domain-containing protein [Hydrogenophaga aquatica]